MCANLEALPMWMQFAALVLVLLIERHLGRTQFGSILDYVQTTVIAIFKRITNKEK